MAETVARLMTPKVETVRPDSTVKEAAVKMEVLDIGPLPVCDGERLVGIVTDRDITTRAVASGKDPNTTPVRSVMTTELVYCYEDQDVDEVSRLMKERQIRRIPVLDRDDKLVGILALGDLAVDEKDTAKDVLHEVSKPSDPELP